MSKLVEHEFVGNLGENRDNTRIIDGLFSSAGMHLGREQARQDDLESIVYTLMYQGHTDPSPHAFRVCVIIMSVGAFGYQIIRHSGVPALYDVATLIRVFFYMGEKTLGRILDYFPISGKAIGEGPAVQSTGNSL